MKKIINLLSDYGKFTYKVTVASIAKQDEKSQYVIYYGSLMKPEN